MGENPQQSAHTSWGPGYAVRNHHLSARPTKNGAAIIYANDYRIWGWLEWGNMTPGMKTVQILISLDPWCLVTRSRSRIGLAICTFAEISSSGYLVFSVPFS